MRVVIADTEVVLDPAGALWLAASRTLVVSDLHLEKASSFARRGMLLPPYDTGATLALLAELDRSAAIRAASSRSAIPFMTAGGYGRLSDPDRLRLAVLQGGREWVWIKGNHDPEFPEDVDGDVIGRAAAGGPHLPPRADRRRSAGRGRRAPASGGQASRQRAQRALPRLRHRRDAHGAAGLRRAGGRAERARPRLRPALRARRVPRLPHRRRPALSRWRQRRSARTNLLRCRTSNPWRSEPAGRSDPRP